MSVFGFGAGAAAGRFTGGGGGGCGSAGQQQQQSGTNFNPREVTSNPTAASFKPAGGGGVGRGVPKAQTQASTVGGSAFGAAPAGPAADTFGRPPAGVGRGGAEPRPSAFGSSATCNNTGGSNATAAGFGFGQTPPSQPAAGFGEKTGFSAARGFGDAKPTATGFGSSATGFGNSGGGASTGSASATGFGGGGGSGCRKCGEEGHFARECPNGGGGGGDDGLCRRCQQPGHIARDCPDGPGDGCFNCGEKGHMKSECSAPLKEGMPAPVTYVPDEEELTLKSSIAAGQNIAAYYDTSKAQRLGPDDLNRVPVISNFDEAELTPLLRENVQGMGYVQPTAVQRYCMPIVAHGYDLMACAQTGSGKTAAFLLPIFSRLLTIGELSTSYESVQQPRAVIVAPTRELAVQIANEGKKLSKGTMIKTVVVYGGVSVAFQCQQVRNGCTVLVGTPGRLMQMMREGTVSLAKCMYFVLDEADRMLDLGFESDVRNMVDNMKMPPKTERNTLMFSATFPQPVQQLATEFLRAEYAFVIIGVLGGANQDIKQTFFETTWRDKKDKLMELLQEDMTKNADGGPVHKTLIFVQRKRTADTLATFLCEMEIPSTSIHGDRDQAQREAALRDFKRAKYPVLVATAVAARGLDIQGVDHVINYDLPSEIEDYVHRIGRTGRVGNAGRATSFYDPSEDAGMLSALRQVVTDACQELPSFMSTGASYAPAAAPVPQYAPPFGAPVDDGDDWDDDGGSKPSVTQQLANTKIGTSQQPSSFGICQMSAAPTFPTFGAKGDAKAKTANDDDDWD